MTTWQGEVRSEVEVDHLLSPPFDALKACFVITFGHDPHLLALNLSDMPIAVSDWSEDLHDMSNARGSSSTGSTSSTERPSTTSDFPDLKHFKVPDLPPAAY